MLNDRIVHLNLARSGVVLDGALLHNVESLTSVERERYVLLHEQDCDTLPMQGVDVLSDL